MVGVQLREGRIQVLSKAGVQGWPKAPVATTTARAPSVAPPASSSTNRPSGPWDNPVTGVPVVTGRSKVAA